MAAEVVVIEGGTVVTMDGAREHSPGHVVVRAGRIDAVGPGAAPRVTSDDVVRRVYAHGCLVTPGLVNTHHHLYQWVTRGLAVDDGLFGWLTTLYPIWGRIDEDTTRAAAAAGLGWLALTGCTTTMDHHYVFPVGSGDLLGAQIEAAREMGLRFLPTRGAMDLGRSRGGLPPDQVVEDIDTILDATAKAVDAYHDPGPDSMLRIGIAPCSPFSVTADLLVQSAQLARDRGVRLHTHLAETLDEADYCAERFGRSPVDYLGSLGWLGDDVWFAHAIHFDDAGIRTLARSGTGVAHCPSSNARLGAGICRLRDLRDAGVPVGLGVDGAASSEANSMVDELRHALLFARARGGPEALTVRDALQGDVAVWRLDTLAHADIVDPVAALVLGAPPPLELLLVSGRALVERGRLTRADERDLRDRALAAHRRLMERTSA